MKGAGENRREYRIRPYHSNGLNWTIARGAAEQDNIVVVTGFMPSWWEREYEIIFGREFHLDPQVHSTTLSRMEEILGERFGDLPNFSFPADYACSFPIERRYGDALIPSLFGCPVSFEDASGHPYAGCLNLSDSQVKALEPPDVEDHPILNALLDKAKGGLDRTTGEPGFEGVINIAYKLRGEELFIDLIQRPQLLHHLCDVIWETLHRVVRRVREWQDPARGIPTYFVNCDCLINMISAGMYHEHFLEYEKKFRESFELFGIHTCNWKVDPYLEAIVAVGELDYLDMGAESNLEQVHRLFPSLTPSVFYHPERLRRLGLSELKREIGELCRRIGKGYLLLSDLEAGTPDSYIRAVYEVAAQF